MMLTVLLALVILPLCLLAVYVYALIRHYLSPLRAIPGDDKLYRPITGDVGKVLSLNCKIKDVLWYRLTTHGDIWRTCGYYGKIRVTIAHPDLVKEVLVSNASKFIRGSPTGAEGIYIVGGIDNLLTASSEIHKILRRVAAPGFRPSILKATVGLVEDRASLLGAKWDRCIEKSGSGFYVNDVIQDDLLDYALDSLGLVGMGIDFGCLRAKTPVAQSIIKIVRASYISVKGIVPGLKYYNHLLHRIFLKNWNFVNMLPGFGPVAPADIQLVIQTAREQIQRCEGGLVDCSHKCLLQVMLNQCEKGCITEDQMISLLTIFILAGTDTSSIALSWVLWNLADQPEMQDDAAVECAQFLKGCDQFTWDDVMDENTLGLTKLVLRESLRLFPPIHSLPRRNTENIEIAGYHIPKGTDFMVSIINMHRNPRVWGPDVLEFRPFRDFREDAFMPFGDGIHKCIGYQLATIEITVALAHLLRQFKFERISGEKTEEKVGITVTPEPALRLKISRRY